MSDPYAFYDSPDPDPGRERETDPNFEPPRQEQQRPPSAQRIIDSAGGQQIPVTDEQEARKVVAELLEHRRRRQGKLIGLAGLPRHGKSEFAKKLRDQLSVGVQAVEEYAKTYSGSVNLYYLPKRHRRDVLIDLAGEDFLSFGDPDVPIGNVDVMTRLLWPVLEQLDGLVFFVSLPLLWSAWNGTTEHGERIEPTEAEARETRAATEKMVRSFQTLLKYTLVAKQLKHIRKARPGLALPTPRGLQGSPLPERHLINDAFQVGGSLRIPVFIAYSKSDLITTPTRSDGLRTAPLALGRGRTRQAVIRPDTADPLVLGRLAFPELFKFLETYVRYFKFDFVQVVHDPSRTPSPEGVKDEALAETYADLRGVLPALEFITEHPWGFTTPGTAATLALDRKHRPARWSQAVATLLSGAPPPAAVAAAASDDSWVP